MIVVQPRPIVDVTSGNINLSGRSGLRLTVSLQDAAGTFLDISALALFFEVDGLLRVALAAGDVATQRIVVLTAAQVASLPLNTALAYVLRDETADPAQTPLTGMIRTFGFSAAPA